MVVTRMTYNRDRDLILQRIDMTTGRVLESQNVSRLWREGLEALARGETKTRARLFSPEKITEKYA